MKKVKFLPDNEEQANEIKAMQKHIRSGDPASWYTLNGKAGTGKTTIVQEAIEPFVRHKVILIIALAHKAKLVLADKLNQRFGPGSIQAATIASAVGMTFDMETGLFQKPKRRVTDLPIEQADVIICDECSMVNEEGLGLIRSKKKKLAKLIFLGDIGQLPPIRKKDSGIPADAPSPTFNTPHQGLLLKRVRQGEQSPILPYADLFWNNSQALDPVEDPVPIHARQSIITPHGSLVFARSSTALDATLPLYKQAVEDGRPELIKTVAYRNNRRKTLNAAIRRYVFGTASDQQLVPGELLMFVDNFEFDQVAISNATEVQAKKVKRTKTSDGWAIWKVTFTFEGRPMEVEVLDRDDATRFMMHLDRMAMKIQDMPKGFKRVKEWAKFWEEKGRFAPVDYAYAITSHKSQGSTYDVCLVAEADIMTVSLASAKAKSHSIYTAITRAKHMAVIMDGCNDEPAAMLKAMELLPRSVAPVNI